MPVTERLFNSVDQMPDSTPASSLPPIITPSEPLNQLMPPIPTHSYSKPYF